MILRLWTKHHDNVIAEHATTGWVKLVLIDDHIGAVRTWLSPSEIVQVAEFFQNVMRDNQAGG